LRTRHCFSVNYEAVQAVAIQALAMLAPTIKSYQSSYWAVCVVAAIGGWGWINKTQLQKSGDVSELAGYLRLR
jgi:hypothetical protein